MFTHFTKCAAVTLCFFLSFGFTNPEAFIFSNNKTEFLGELRSFIEATKNKDHIALFTQFEKQVNGSAFSEPELGEIILVCNRMSEKKMQAAPYFTEYLKGLNVVKFNPIGKNNFMDWHGTLGNFLENISQKDFRRYKAYLIFSQQLFDGKSLHYAKGGIEWQPDAPTPAVLWEVNEPVVKYLKTNLKGTKKNATIAISGTSGVYYPLQNKWVGQGGIVSWSRISDNIGAQAELSTYEIDMNRGEYTAENAKLTYPKYFKTKVITGQLKDKILSTGGGRKSSYPRFATSEENVKLNLGQGLLYEGGFKMEGVKIEGHANAGKKSKLTHRNRAGELTYRLAGRHFSLNNEEFVSAKNVEAVLYFGRDSIYHPSIDSKADIKKAILTLRKGEKAISKAAFYDSYHNIYIDTQKLNWYAEENRLMINETKIKSGAGSQTVTVESADFYSDKYMRRIQNVASYNPVIEVMQYAKKEGRDVSAEGLAQHINPNFSVSNIQSLLFDLEENGFVRYLSKEKRVLIYDKVFRYAAVHAGQRDSDILKLKSEYSGGNAEIDFTKKEMTLKGVKQVEFSSRQKTAALPTGKELKIGENRALDFDGTLFAGFATFTGSDYKFDYDKFWIKADSVSYLDFYLPEANGEAFAIGSRIESVKGTILIDAPANKSGREDLTIFPSFKSKGPSYVYYDKENKLGDAYPRDSFHFELEPFFLQELRKLTPEHFALKGTMRTAGIFPDFEETLRLQDHDKSLGFTTTAPAEGYAVFAEKGNYKGDLVLSNSGLQGKGRLVYEKTDITSEDMVFRPGNMNCSAKNFDLAEDKTAGLPRVNGKDVRINWQPYADSMYVESSEKSFDVFTESKHEVAGMLIYTPGGLKGTGTFKWDEGEMDSKMFDFGHYSVQSDTTNLQIKALETDALAFDTKNVAGVMDFEKKSGNFKANDKDAVTTMPHNEYITTLNEFEWNLGKKNITFIAEEGKTGVFTSTDKAQKELTFEGKTGRYDFPTGQLHIGGVERIQSADAYIFPADGEVTVLPGGAMEKLTNATILASTENEYHTIRNASLQIHGKEKYTGQGIYNYDLEGLKQEIPLTNIVGQRVGKRTENRTETVAEATVGTSQPFVMAQGFNFEGGIELRSSSPDLGYKGYAQMQSEMLTNPRWFYIDCQADKNNLLLELDKPKDKEDQRMHSGFYLNQESRRNYARFLMPLSSRKDHAFMDATGALRYDAAAGLYITGDSLKMMNSEAKGNVLTFSEKTGELKGKGKINLVPAVKGPEVTAIGQIRSGLAQGETVDTTLNAAPLTAKIVSTVNFGLPKELQTMIYTDFQSASFEAQTVQYQDTETYETALAELVGDPKKLPQSMQQLKKGNTFGIPTEDCTFDFMLTELNLVWDADYQSFISTDKKIGLAAMTTKGYHKYVEGAAEYKMPASGDDRFTLLLTSPGGNYYFFSYQAGILSTHSSYEPYNTKVAEMKDKERVIKLKGGSFELQPGTASMVSNFKSRAALQQK